MKKWILLALAMSTGAGAFEMDEFESDAGTIRITFVGHGTLMIQLTDRIVHIDPVGSEANYSEMPKADLILVTHHHSDHLDKGFIDSLKKEGTVIIATGECKKQIPEAVVMKNGDSRTLADLSIDAIPAYNTSPGRDRFHPRGRDNGYILTYGGKRIYIAGDTEVTPEMKRLEDIDIAFLPMNQPYTMTPAQTAEAARAFRPKVLYPYHFGASDTAELTRLLAGDEEIEVRIRALE